MRYMSLCSGIEAASVAWEPLGWKPVAFAEIEPFPSAVLAFHFPGVPNYGDITRFREWPEHAIDVLVGGTPCQSFSIAGLRKGLDDDRGNLMFAYAQIARRYRPRWLGWENVPGVLSSDGGRDFASLLGLLSGRRIETPADGWRNAGIIESYKGAYGVAWRVLDAQFVRVDGFPFAIPQRRRRVFLVGYSGDWRRAAAVLFDSESLRGDAPPLRTTQESFADTAGARIADGGELGGVTMAARLVAFGEYIDDGVSSTIQSRDYKGPTDLIAYQSAVRRLTPVESERLQGFRDDYTNIPWQGRNEAPDDLRYMAIGNSMAVNCMRLIGRRIQLVNGILWEKRKWSPPPSPSPAMAVPHVAGKN